MRGRAPGEVPAILRGALLRTGLLATSIEVHLSELGAVKRVLEWARPGDVLVMPVHDRGVREQVLALLRQ
jgi:cyanophycin synthetase